jgi:alkanesulfonate monooxygenase SsuD/methylene tetrahydromethanopterin reductase-like flavin-dependent oxidoreductase (luciferase family)
MSVPSVPRFGVAIDLAPGPGADYASGLNELAPLIAACDALGYHAVSAGESYVYSRSDAMGFHSPNALMLLAVLAQHMTRPRLIAGVSLLAGWAPLRLAHDTALVDQISGGRLTVGLGLGSPAAWQAFGVAPTELGPRLEDTIAFLRRAWQGTVPVGEELRELVPRPVQAAGPPLLVGGARRISAERAAALGDGFVASSGYSRALIGLQAERYRQACGSRPPGQVSVNRLTVVARTHEEAWARYHRHVAPLVQAYAVSGAAGTQAPDATPLDRCLVGTPDEVGEQVAGYLDLGVTDLQLRVRPRGLPVDEALESLTLFAERIRPGLEQRGARS